MKALILKEYNTFEYIDMDRPLIKSDDEVLINVKACGICGSDVHGMDGSTGRRIPPIVMTTGVAGGLLKPHRGSYLHPLRGYSLFLFLVVQLAVPMAIRVTWFVAANCFCYGHP